MRCGGCKTVAYCSEACQRQDWERHKPVCSMMRNAIPVFWVYEWHEGRMEVLRNWAAMTGPEVVNRFYRCFGNDH